MSLYFDGFIACDLKPDTPQQVIAILEYMTRKQDYAFNDVPDHVFFQSSDWHNFLQITYDYTCAPGFVISEFKKAYRYTQYGKDEYRYTLSFRRTMHDDVEFYVNWWDFLLWIAPYSETQGFVGYYREQYSPHPDLIYFKNGTIFRNEIKQLPEGLKGELWDDGK